MTSARLRPQQPKLRDWDDIEVTHRGHFVTANSGFNAKALGDVPQYARPDPGPQGAGPLSWHWYAITALVALFGCIVKWSGPDTFAGTYIAPLIGFAVLILAPFTVVPVFESLARWSWPVTKWLLAGLLAFGLLYGAVQSAQSGESGIASVYSTREQGSRTASGIKLHDGALTAAHKSLPFGTKVKVTNKRNGKSVVVTITDRGPFVRGRVIDLTNAGASALGFSGLTQVSLDVMGR